MVCLFKWGVNQRGMGIMITNNKKEDLNTLLAKYFYYYLCLNFRIIFILTLLSFKISLGSFIIWFCFHNESFNLFKKFNKPCDLTNVNNFMNYNIMSWKKPPQFGWGEVIMYIIPPFSHECGLMHIHLYVR